MTRHASVVETPTSDSLYAVESADTVYVAGSGGAVYRRADEEWQVLADDGPLDNGTTLYGLALTDDEKRVWVAGSSGVVGEYDFETDDWTDRSVDNVGNTFNDIAVTGTAGDASVFIADDSGQIHYSHSNGLDGTWEYHEPGSGTGLVGIEFVDTTTGYVIDGNGELFATVDGQDWVREHGDLDLSCYDLDTGAGTLWMSADEFALEYTNDGWQRTELVDDSFYGVAASEQAAAVVGGDGRAFLTEGGDWTLVDTETDETLRSVTFHDGDLVAVGSSGVVVQE